MQNLKLFWKFVGLALMVPVTAIAIIIVARNGTAQLRYQYDNLYGFMLIPLLSLDEGNLHRQVLTNELNELTRPDRTEAERAASAESSA